MTTIRLIRENVVKSTKQILSAADVYKAMRFLENEDREKFYVLHLDAQCRILAMELISVGSLTFSIVHPREVFKGAILNNSNSIVCVHNHPSGDATPSLNDKIVAESLRKAGKIIGIDVNDFVIIGCGEFTRVIPPEEQLKAKELQRKHEKSKKGNCEKVKARHNGRIEHAARG